MQYSSIIEVLMLLNNYRASPTGAKVSIVWDQFLGASIATFIMAQAYIGRLYHYYSGTAHHGQGSLL